MTTQTTDTTTTSRPFGAPARPTKKQACRCHNCGHLDTSEAPAWADAVGWCKVFCQYRSASIKRDCDSYSDDEPVGKVDR